MSEKLWLFHVFREKSVKVCWKQWFQVVYFMELWVFHRREAVIMQCISWKSVKVCWKYNIFLGFCHMKTMISVSALHGIMSFFISTKLWLSDVFREKSVKVHWKYNVFLGLCHMETMISNSVLHGIMSFSISTKLWLSDVFREESVKVRWKYNVFLGLCHMKTMISASVLHRIMSFSEVKSCDYAMYFVSNL